MSSKTASLPDGLEERTPDWHFQKLVQFTKYKHNVGEPSPHLAMVGHMVKGAKMEDRIWALGCYAASYCLPTAQMLWTEWPLDRVHRKPDKLFRWLEKNWKGIVTRTERRCVRSVPKMHRCLVGCAKWVGDGFPLLLKDKEDTEAYYERAWESVATVPFFGRYIAIRFIEGLRRFCGIPAYLRDIRSIGGWSPKKALVYFYPKCHEYLLSDTKEGNALTDHLAEKLLTRIHEKLSYVDHYVLAAMLCEYREAFERRHQYPARTLDQEPGYYTKVEAYWGTALDSKLFWSTRSALFPHKALGELCGWHGVREELSGTLRDHGYLWADLKYCYRHTKDLAKPTRHGEHECQFV